MPIESVLGTDLRYYLIAFDEDGRERTDDPDGLISDRIAEAAADGVTDVFFMSHGWQGDVPAARSQYAGWIRALATLTAGHQRMLEVRPNLRTLLIGLHWPSLPFGDEGLGAVASFDVSAGVTTADVVDGLVDQYAARIADTLPARSALRVIFERAMIDPAPPTLPADVRQAYEVLNRESGLGSDGPGGGPGDDREAFNPETIYQFTADEAASFGGFDILGGLVAPVRLLSFWKMKDRGRRIGESGGHTLLRRVQEVAPDAHVHLMGHSFGSGVVSGAVGGPGGVGPVRPVDSVTLVQGAISLWSYAAEMPFAPGEAGYFASLLSGHHIRGPIVTTQSRFDTAVGKLYPLAAGVAGQFAFDAALPKYGGIGAFGLQGEGLPASTMMMLGAEETYGFQPGKIYNLNCDNVIRDGGPPSGAHSDIQHPEVANAIWEAARTWPDPVTRDRPEPRTVPLRSDGRTDSEVPGMDDELILANGIDGSTGTYLLPPLTPQQLRNVATGRPMDRLDAEELTAVHERCTQGVYGPRPGIDPTDLAQAGWAVLFARDADPAIREALSPLLELRKCQATKIDERHYKEFVGPEGYLPGQTHRQFLAKKGISPASQADPKFVPYYVLIVGDPDTIPYEFQTLFDVVYATGRICFDTIEEYAQYAQSVVAAEKGEVKLPRKAAFFGAQNPGDPATRLSSELLVKRLAGLLGENDDWSVTSVIGEQATKPQLARLLGGEETPALLFTASHGVGFPLGDPRQLPHQGALVCQEWPGPLGPRQPMNPDWYLSGDDIGDDARLHGLIAVHFACYGAGTPQRDAFSHGTNGAPKDIAERPFMARLPRRLLSHPKGGALAVVGHIERAWAYSFTWPRVGEQTQAFQDFQMLLLQGHPIGAAVEYFNLSYAALATELSSTLEDIGNGLRVEDLAVANMWTANNDAKNYTIIGDPAVRLPVGDAPNGRAAEGMRAVIIRPPAAAPVPVAVPPQITADDETPHPLSVIETSSAAPAADLGSIHMPLTSEVERLSAQLGEMLKRLTDSAVTIRVRTFSSPDLSILETTEGAMPPGATLRAASRISDDGIDTYVSEHPWDGDQRLWSLHLDAVQRAQANRMSGLKTLSTTVADVLSKLHTH
ncbi:MAG: hypothetical protein AB7P40_02875 [Chloroflexota bacterium]